MRTARLTLGLALAAGACTAAPQLHHTLDATLQVPFQAADGLTRPMTVRAEFPGAPAGTVLFGRITVRDPAGAVVSVKDLEQTLQPAQRAESALPWPESDAAAKVAAAQGAQGARTLGEGALGALGDLQGALGMPVPGF